MVLSLWWRQLRERASPHATPGRVFANQGLVFGQAQHFIAAGDHNGPCKYIYTLLRRMWSSIYRRPHLNYCHNNERQQRCGGIILCEAKWVKKFTRVEWSIPFVNVHRCPSRRRRFKLDPDWDLSLASSVVAIPVTGLTTPPFASFPFLLLLRFITY